MRIIKQGNLPEKPEDKARQVTCFICKSVIEYNLSDVRTVSRGSDVVIDCPLCHQPMDLDDKIAFEVETYHAKLSIYNRTHQR